MAFGYQQANLLCRTVQFPGGTDQRLTVNAAGALEVGGVALTIPAAGTLATLAGTQTLTNKTITAAVLSGTFTGTYTLAGTPTISSPTLTAPAIGAATGTSLSLTGALAGGPSITPGVGTSAALVRDSGVWTNGTVILSRIVVDLTDLVGSTTDLDIIGNTGGAASANFGQITAAVTGTIVGGRMTCFELPAGGADDLDLYSATVGTGAQDVDITTLTERVLITSGAAWAVGTSRYFTGIPAADEFLYIVNGEAGTAGTFTAGIFLIEMFGT